MTRSADARRTVGAGVLSALVALVGSWVPQLWYDEMATLSATHRSVGELWRMLGNVDAVHGLFYLLMSGWVRLVPDNPFWLRLPGVVAIGVAGAGVYLLTRRLTSRRTAMLAGVVFAFLPATTQTGIEARPYPFVVGAATWATVGLTSLIGATISGRRWWPAAVGYTVAVIVTIGFSVLAGLILGAHAVTVGLIAWQRRNRTDAPSRRLVVRFLGCAVVAVAVSAPLIATVSAQSAQVSWISKYVYNPILRVTDLFFPNSALLMLFALVLLVALATRAVRRRRMRLRRGLSMVTVVTLPWLIVPIVLLAVYSALVTPAFLTRYLSYVSPAAAILLAVGFGWLAGRHTVRTVSTAWILAVLFVVLALPSVHMQHARLAKPVAIDYRGPADHVAKTVAPTDCLVYGQLTKAHQNARYIAYGYPQIAAGRDIMLDRTRGSAVERGELWDANLPDGELGARAADCRRVVVITDAAAAAGPRSALLAAGFVEGAPYGGPNLQILRFDRPA